MATCIFCDNENEATSIEHIVPESLGNEKYVIEKGKVCDVCNGKFSKFEGTALSQSILIMERARFGVKTKRGKNVKGKLNDLEIEGNKNFEKQLITLTELNKDNFEDFDLTTKTKSIHVASFDKSEVATSKLLLKIALESLFTSQRKIFTKYNFVELKDFLQNRNAKDWPFTITDYEENRFISIPRFTEKHLLKKNHIELKYFEKSHTELLFKFKYGAVPMTINLLNRNLNWIADLLQKDKDTGIYPEYFKNKLPNVSGIPSDIKNALLDI